MPSELSRRCTAGLFATTIFLSAFLLFQVQPILGKFILPWFGGSPTVWTTCMLVFQVLLFGGYAYAHLLSSRLSVRNQVVVHVVLLVLGCALLPIAPDSAWKPLPGESPVWRIILLSLCSVGLPYFLLSSTGPLVQGWFSRTLPGVSPYRLYALSNLGSLLALLSYPFAVEPALTTTTQSTVWSVLFGLFAVLCAVCSVAMVRTDRGAVPAQRVAELNDRSSRAPAGDLQLLWFCLAMVPSVLLLAVTNQVCLDVAVIPFLWVLPLALYLLTFILAFDASRWYSRTWCSLGAVMSIACTSLILLRQPSQGLVWQLLAYFSALFFCCLFCHGELARLKPDPAWLTKYYLMTSAGGAAGGLVVCLLAPVIFTGYYELHLAFVSFGLLYLAVRRREELPPDARVGWGPQLKSLAVLCGVTLLVTQLGSTEGNRAVARNFYGVLRVRDVATNRPETARRELVHGRIVHGAQFLDSQRKLTPTAYFGRTSGVGQLLSQPAKSGPRHVGVIGLGIGTLAGYAQAGDRYRFYEINPDVIRLAQEHFSFLSDCAGEISLVEGDARLVLEYEAPQKFDVLVLDAFSGDAIPVHLLTDEAFVVYLKHLKTDGVLACHISNLHFDLRPVLAGVARQRNWSEQFVVSQADARQGAQIAYWYLMSPHAENLLPDVPVGATLPESTEPILWTDDFSNLLDVLR